MHIGENGTLYGVPLPKTNRLVAVITCDSRRKYADAQRATWVKDCNWADVRFFLARQDREPLPDEIFLDVADDYDSLPAKVQAVVQWAANREYEVMLKLDDDIILFPTKVVFPRAHYTGWAHKQSNANWCSGMAYWLSRDSMNEIATAELTEDKAEDRWVGSVLAKAGILPTAIENGGIQWLGARKTDGVRKMKPLPPNLGAILRRAYVAGEFTPEEMSLVYR